MGGLNSRWIKNDFQFIKMGCICHVSLNRSKLGADYQEKFEILTLGGRKLSFGNKDELWQIIDLLSYVQIQPNCVLM